MKDIHKIWLESNGYKDISDDDYVTFRSADKDIDIWIRRDGRFCAQKSFGMHLYCANGYASPQNAVKALERLINKYKENGK